MIAADAIVWAADHRDAEVYLGWPTVQAIAANTIAPQYLDEYRTEHGVDSQHTDERERPDRPLNLWQPGACAILGAAVLATRLFAAAQPSLLRCSITPN